MFPDVEESRPSVRPDAENPRSGWLVRIDKMAGEYSPYVLLETRVKLMFMLWAVTKTGDSVCRFELVTV